MVCHVRNKDRVRRRLAWGEIVPVIISRSESQKDHRVDGAPASYKPRPAELVVGFDFAAAIWRTDEEAKVSDSKAREKFRAKCIRIVGLSVSFPWSVA